MSFTRAAIPGPSPTPAARSTISGPASRSSAARGATRGSPLKPPPLTPAPGGAPLPWTTLAANQLTEIHGDVGNDLLTVTAPAVATAQLIVYGDAGADTITALTSAHGRSEERR